MNTWKSAAIALAVIAAPLEAHARTPPSDQDRNQVVCNREGHTGTRFRKKVCRTKAQLESISEQHKRDAKEMIDRPIVNTGRD
jgi:hypothetical protein